MPCFIGWPDGTALRYWGSSRLDWAATSTTGCIVFSSAGLDEFGPRKRCQSVIGCQILPLPASCTCRLNPSLALDRVLFPSQPTTPRQPQLPANTALDLILTLVCR
jgi:hypothetical protein